MIYSILIDADQEILDNDYDPEFMKEKGIISIIPTGDNPGNGYIEIMIIFQDKESGYEYIKEFDMDFYEMKMNPEIKNKDILGREMGKNNKIILSGFDNEIALDIIDKELEEEYGIERIEYNEDENIHTLYFYDGRSEKFLEEWESNNQN